MTKNEQVEVTEADRELCILLLGWDLSENMATIRAGSKDAHPKMQAIARHRIEATRTADSERAGVDMQVLLPPASDVDPTYLGGWCEGQAYLIENYGKDGDGDAAIQSVNDYLASTEQPAPSSEAVPVNASHLNCPKCGEEIDLIPPPDTFLSRQSKETG